MPSGYSVVAINPKTKRPYKRLPKTYRKVKYAIQGPRGGITPIAGAPLQPFTKKDFRGLNKIIAETGKKNFVLYEEKSRTYERGPDGKPIPTGKVDEAGKPIYKKKIKLTYARPKRKQRPVLYDEAKRVREVDIGFKTHSPRDLADQKLLQVIEPNSPPKIVVLKGETIKDALRGLQFNLKKSDLKKDKFYQMVIKIWPPGQAKPIIIPKSGAIKVDGFAGTDLMRAGQGLGLYNPVDTMANIKTEIGKSIRYALKDYGYRFTSLVTLKKIAAKELQKPIRTMNQVPNRLRLIGSPRSQVSAVKLKNQITNKYRVEIIIQFDMV